MNNAVVLSSSRILWSSGAAFSVMCCGHGVQLQQLWLEDQKFSKLWAVGGQETGTGQSTFDLRWSCEFLLSILLIPLILGAGVQMAPDSGCGDSYPTCCIAKANSGLLHESAPTPKASKKVRISLDIYLYLKCETPLLSLSSPCCSSNHPFTTL